MGVPVRELGHRLGGVVPAAGALMALATATSPARAVGPDAWPGLGPSAVDEDGRAAAIRRFAARWSGTPYQWGGTSRAGIDCSAYLREMYRDLFGVELPRTTRDQIGLGVDLPLRLGDLASGLEPGDVLFYVDGVGTPSHVVAYAGKGMITHSASGRGVVVEPIERIAGRRVLARRFLFPRPRGSTAGARDGATAEKAPSYAPIPAAAPLAPSLEVPCPASARPEIRVVRRLARSTRETDLDAFARDLNFDLCRIRALAEALEARPEPEARATAARLRRLELSIDSFATAEEALFR